MRRRKVQCIRSNARPGEDDVQANLNACKGKVPKQKEDCIGTSLTFRVFVISDL